MSKLKQRLFISHEINGQKLPYGVLVDTDGTAKQMTFNDYEQQRRADDFSLNLCLPISITESPARASQAARQQEPQVVRLVVDVETPQIARTKQLVKRNRDTGQIESTVTNYEY